MMNWIWIAKALLYAYSLYAFVKLILLIFMSSNSPSLIFFRRKLWPIFLKKEIKRISKVGTIFAFPMIMYIELDPKSKEIYIKEGFKAWSIDFEYEVRFKIDRFVNQEKERKRIKEETKDSPLAKNYSPFEIVDIREQMKNLKNKANEN